MLKKFFFMAATLLLMLSTVLTPEQTLAHPSDDVLTKRMSLYKKTEALTNVPWYYLAAVDTYERGLRRARNDRPKETGAIAIFFSDKQWAGALNPNSEDNDPLSISLFGGIGLDGNGDKIANRFDDEDVLYTFARLIERHGYDEQSFRISLWEHYRREQTVQIITGHAKIYKKYATLHLDKRVFPLPLHANYSYRSTWGDKRGWGGRRIHEGTDIFASYNVPVLATTYGIVETKGWNKYGGWRIGIRDLNNVYHYYAHLNGFAKGIEKGKIVEPGETIGYVGSSGYGKPGTQGKFPPHLHYGMYRDNGIIEWSFDPYPSLRAWERETRQRKR